MELAIPLISYISVGAQALPIAAVIAVRRRPLPPSHRLVVTFCVLLLLSDVQDVLFARLRATNDFTQFYVLPVEGVVTAWLLAAMQPNRVIAATMRALGLGVVAASAVVILATDPMRTFDPVVAPVIGMLMIAASLFTLVRRTVTFSEPLAAADWFWICLALALFWIAMLAVPPFHRAFVHSNPRWVMNAYILKAWAHTTAWVLMSWGILCQRVPVRSSGRILARG